MIMYLMINKATYNIVTRYTLLKKLLGFTLNSNSDSAQIVNLFEGIPFLFRELLEACGIIVIVNKNEAYRQCNCNGIVCGGLGTCPKEIFKIRYSEIAFCCKFDHINLLSDRLFST